MKAGQRIKLEWHVMGHATGDWVEYTVEEFRHCLGIFESDEHRKAGKFTPLCDLYDNGPDSEQRHIPNFGAYMTNQVPSWIECANHATNATEEQSVVNSVDWDDKAYKNMADEVEYWKRQAAEANDALNRIREDLSPMHMGEPVIAESVLEKMADKYARDSLPRDGMFNEYQLDAMRCERIKAYRELITDIASNLTRPIKPTEGDLTIDDYKEAFESHRRMVRELDVLINGKEGAAEQASLCDLVGQIEKEGLVIPAKASPNLFNPDSIEDIEEFLSKGPGAVITVLPSPAFGVGWQPASNQPPGDINKWSKDVIAVTNYGNVFKLAHMCGPDGGGYWQRPNFEEDEEVMLWTHDPFDYQYNKKPKPGEIS